MKRIMKLSKHKLVILMLMGTICLILPVQSRADKKPDEVKIPQSIYPGLVAMVMKFIEGPKNDDTLYIADGVLGMPSAYHEFNSHADLRKITEYAFNPDIPDIATMPSSVRLFHWMDAKGQRRQTPREGRYLGDLDTPVVEKTMQYVEITPDANSGAYYGYNLHQTLIVFKVKRKHIYSGLKRFAKSFKQIMEYPALPPVEVLATDFSRIRKFSDDTLRSKMNT